MANFRLVPDVNVTVPNGPALLASLNALARRPIDCHNGRYKSGKEGAFTASAKA